VRAAFVPLRGVFEPKLNPASDSRAAP